MERNNYELHIRLPKWVYDQLKKDKYVNREGISSFIRNLIYHYLEEVSIEKEENEINT